MTTAFLYSVCAALDIILNEKLILMLAIFSIFIKSDRIHLAAMSTQIFEQERIARNNNNYYWCSELRYLGVKIKTEIELGNDMITDLVDSIKSAQKNMHLLGRSVINP
jgi:hypothetical protein